MCIRDSLDTINFSSRSIGSATEDEIDIATIGFTTPIYISPPTKVKKLGVVHTVITSIFNEQQGSVNLNTTMPELLAYSDTGRYGSDAISKPAVDADGNEIVDYANLTASRPDAATTIATTFNNYGLLVLNNTIKLIDFENAGTVTWQEYVKAFPNLFQAGISQIRLLRNDFTSDIVGTVTINPLDPFSMSVNWDIDTLPTDTVINGPTGEKTKIDYIVDPLKTNPTNLKKVGLRLLLLDNGIGDGSNTDGADAWKNSNNTDLIASANDIVEWSGTAWSIVFDASASTTTTYTTNLNTGIQYKYQNNEWVLSYEGEYPHGTWRIKF